MPDNKRYALEADITKAAHKWLSSQPDIAHYKASDRYRIGVSDILANVGGTLVLLELKADKGTPSPHQLQFIKKMTKPGGFGGVCYTLKDVKDLVNAARSGR